MAEIRVVKVAVERVDPREEEDRDVFDMAWDSWSSLAARAAWVVERRVASLVAARDLLQYRCQWFPGFSCPCQRP
jgi:hypothetical protein